MVEKTLIEYQVEILTMKFMTADTILEDILEIVNYLSTN